MKTNLFTLLFASFVLLFSSELKAQVTECDLPDFTVQVPFAPGEVVIDLFTELGDAGEDITLACEGWIGNSGCFTSAFILNTNFDGFLCVVSSWEVSLKEFTTQESCCGEHELIYYVDYDDGATGSIYTRCGILTIIIDCSQDCGIIDFSDPDFSPVSNANGDSTTMPLECIKVCENSSLVALAPIFGPGYLYDWDVQGGLITGGQNTDELDVLWGPHGAGNISVTITHADPNFTPITYGICIEILEGPEAMFTTPGYACLETPMYFDGSTSNILSNVNITDFQWDFGDNESGQGETVSHDYDNAGTYTVTLTVYSEIVDDQGNVICICADVYQEDVLVDDLVGPNIYWVSTLCEGDASSYWTDDVCGTYLWSVYDSNGTPITPPDFTGQGNSEIFVTWGQGPHGTIELVVTGCNPDHCTDPTSVQVPIIPATDEISGPDVVCVGEVATYSLTKWNSVDYDWSVTGGTIINTPNSAENTITIQWDTSGSIHVDYSSEFLQCLPGHTPNDCTGFATLNVDVRPKFSISPSPLDVCIGETTTFTASGSLGLVFNWSNSGLFTQAVNQNSVDIEWTSAGNYTVTATPTNSSDYCNSSATAFVTVHEVAKPAAITITGPTEVCANSPSYIYEVAASQGLNAIWTPSATTGVPSANPYVGLYTEVTWGATGPFRLDVEYQMIDAPNCSSDTTTIEVEELTLDPLYITPLDAPCANETADYSLPGIHQDATIHWTIHDFTPPYAQSMFGSVVDGQGTDYITIQWNDILTSNASVWIYATAQLCDDELVYKLEINLNRAIVPTVVGTDFCVGGDPGILTVTNASSFGSINWGGSYPTTSPINTTTPGDYIVNTIDINGCPSSGGATIALNPAPMLNLTTNGPNTLWLGGSPSSTEIVAPDNVNYTYAWTCCGNSTIIGTNPTITHNWQGVNLDASYKYSLTITETTTGCTNTKDIYIYEEDLPDGCDGDCCDLATYTPPQIISASLSSGYCDTWDFYQSGGGTNVTNISWNFGDSSPLSYSNPTTHTYTDIGYYNVSLSGWVPDATNSSTLCLVKFETVPVDVAMIAQFGAEVSCEPDPWDSPQLCLTDETAYLPGTEIDELIFNTTPSSGSVVYSTPYPPSATSPVIHCFGSLSPNNYTADLMATHSSGCIDDFTLSVTLPCLVIITTDPFLSLFSTICLEDPYEFTASCDGAVSFDWNFGDSAIDGVPDDAFYTGNEPPIHAYEQNPLDPQGNYYPTVSVVATHANGCQFTNSKSLVVVDNPPAQIISSADGDFKFCAGPNNFETLELSPPPPGTFTVDWWGPDDPSIPAGNGSSIDVTLEGEYGATINYGNCDTELDPVLVQQWPLVPAFITGPSILCEGDCTELIAPSGDYSYAWSNLNNSITSSTSSLNLCSYDIPNGDTFSLIITDGISGCISTSSITIDVEPTPIIQASTYPTLPCEGQPINLFVDNPNPPQNMVYVWTGGNANPYTVLNAGTYTVIGTNTDTGCKGTATVVVFPCPSLCEVPSGCYTACKPGKTICAGSEALETYQWNFDPDGNGYSPIPGETDPCFTATQDGMYTLTATNIYGCPKTSNLLDLEFIDCDSCQFAESDMLDLQLQYLGTSLYSTDIDGDGENEDASCCIWAIDPIISTANGADPNLLCMEIHWGDEDVQYNVPLGAPVEHCYTEGCSDYEINIKIKCCDDNTNSYPYTATAFCECVPDCYIRNAFWESFSPNPGLNTCEVCFTGTQFLGPDMQNHQNPSYSIIGIGNSVNITESGQYNICVDLEPGNYNVCRTVEGVSDVNELCESVHCHDIEVVCCDSTTIDPCVLPENIVFYPTEDPISGTCEDGCEWHFCLGGGGIDFEFDDSHCFEWDYGDGTSYSSNTLQCASHCFDQSGTYNVCLTVYCCDDTSQSQSVQYCEIIEVNCGAPCELSAVAIDLEQMFVSDPNGSCCFGVCPILFPLSDVDPMSLCIDIDWGDDSAPLINEMFAMCYDHCYGANGTYTITVTVYCCDDPANVFVFTETVSCSGCELPADLVFYPDGGYASGVFCPDGECEYNFCLGINFDFSFFNDSHCFRWDYGDGTIQTSNTPDCGVHCYPSGTYNVCLRVFCCDDSTQYVEYCETIVVVCDGGGGGGCEYDQTMVDFEWGTNSTCANGCDEVWFCASDFGMDANTCISWDFGDGNSYSPALPECPIHCYNSPGVYTACLTVYCCEEGPDSPSAYTICHEVVVSCGGGGCELSAGEIDAEQMFLSADSCCFGVCPTLMPWSNVDPMSLCIDIDWGDGSAPLLNEMFAQCYDHCYGANGTYTITVSVYCCDDPASVFVFTNTVSCGGCDLPAIDFEWGRNGACANTGCDEMWFCLIDYPTDPNVCLSWDFGDGNIYNPSLPDCPIHCYNSAGVYSVCLTVYCCDGGADSSSAYTICHEVVVSCGCAVDCPDFNAGLGLMDFGTISTDASGAECCEYGLVPELLSECQIDVLDLCINVDWGDGSAPLNAPFAMGYEHCFPIGGTYTVTMDVFCCVDGAESQSWTFTETVTCTGSGCELPADLVFYPDPPTQSGGAFCPDGECEWNFCLGINFDFSSLNDSHCFKWDYGDGTVQFSNTPECGAHCYPSGTYNVCFTVFCCDDPTQYVEYCETIVVNCDGGAPCVLGPEDFAPIEIIAFDDSPNGVCCFGICPMLMPWSDVDLMSLCIDIDWGDDSAPILGQMFAMCYDHCYGADGTYTITVTVYCCDDPDISYVITETVSCGGGALCDLPVIDFEWGTNSTCANTGCDEMWFCLDNYPSDPNVCLSWDFGDGNIYNPSLPDCPIHCYNSAGVYNVCLTVSCCEEGSSYIVCHEVVVSCTGSGCEVPPIGFEFGISDNSPNCTNGCEVSFCSDIYTPDENICLEWDFGDGNYYYPSQLYPDCPIHCYSASGTYNACLSVYCCDEGPDGPSAWISCQTVDVTCWQPIEACTGDFDLDGFIGVVDLLELLGAYGGPCE